MLIACKSSINDWSRPIHSDLFLLPAVTKLAVIYAHFCKRQVYSPLRTRHKLFASLNTHSMCAYINAQTQRDSSQHQNENLGYNQD